MSPAGLERQAHHGQLLIHMERASADRAVNDTGCSDVGVFCGAAAAHAPKRKVIKRPRCASEKIESKCQKLLEKPGARSASNGSSGRNGTGADDT